MDNLSKEELERYRRQILFSEIGEAGQEKIKQASVLVVGAGGLGSSCAFYLTAAGIGKLGLADSDIVELNNLNRQILHTTKDIGRAKTDSAKEKLQQLNPEVDIICIQKRLTFQNVLNIIKDYNVIVAAVDNFPTRYLINDACVLNNKPLVNAGVFGFEGQILSILPFKGACFRCVFTEPAPVQKNIAVLGAVPGALGALQATEVLKIILGQGELLLNRLLVYNWLNTNFREVKIRRNPNCPLCGDKPSITTLRDRYNFN